MGWIKDAKANMLAKQAAEAYAAGHRVFAAMLNTPSSQSSSFTMSGEVRGWAEMIEAIEEQGWALWQWAVGADVKGRPQAYPLFRRRSPNPPPAPGPRPFSG